MTDRRGILSYWVSRLILISMGDIMSLNEERARRGFLFEAPDGEWLYMCEWMPVGEPKALVLLLHGYTEHSQRYEHVAGYLNKKGYAVLAFDLRGHGMSPGPRGYFKSFDQHVADARHFVRWVNRTHKPRCPIFLLGSSMGGLIWTLLAMKEQDLARGMVLSSALFKLGKDFSFWRVLGAKLMTLVWPRCPAARMPVKSLSRDQREIEKYKSDPLVFHGWIRAATGAAIGRACDLVGRRAAELTLPLLAMHGLKDTVTSARGSKELAESARGTNVYVPYEDCYHLLFHELPEVREQVLARMECWFEDRMRVVGPPHAPMQPTAAPEPRSPGTSSQVSAESAAG